MVTKNEPKMFHNTHTHEQQLMGCSHKLIGFNLIVFHSLSRVFFSFRFFLDAKRSKFIAHVKFG